MRYFVVFLMLLSIGMFAMGCGDSGTKEKPKDKPKVEEPDNGEPEPGPVEPGPTDPDEPTP